MIWNVGMAGEGEGRDKLLTEGEHEAEILSVDLISAEQSKSGNPYFVWELKTSEGEVTVRTTLLKKKRWLLKQMLSACGITAKDGDTEERYSFEPEDVVGQIVKITIQNRKNTYTGRDGVQRTSTKSEVNRIQKTTEEEDIANAKKEVDKFLDSPTVEEIEKEEKEKKDKKPK